MKVYIDGKMIELRNPTTEQLEATEVIRQLNSLIDNSKSFIDINEPDSLWHQDIMALDFAIRTIKKTYKLDS